MRDLERPRERERETERKREGGGEEERRRKRTKENAKSWNSTSSTVWNSSNGRSLKSDQLRSITFPFSIDIFCPVTRPSDQSPCIWGKIDRDRSYDERPCMSCRCLDLSEIAGPLKSVISAQRAAASAIIVGMWEPSTWEMSAHELRFHPDYVALWVGPRIPVWYVSSSRLVAAVCMYLLLPLRHSGNQNSFR